MIWYGTLGSNTSTQTSKPRPEHIRIVNNEPAPTPEHVCSRDGYWITPALTREKVAENRKTAYEHQTDGLLKEIGKDQMLGEDVTEKLMIFKATVEQIKADNPYPLSVQSHYNPVIS